MLGLASMLVPVSAASASAIELRFVHAAPGAGSARLTAGGRDVGGVVSFAEATRYTRVPDGSVHLTLHGDGRRLASADPSLEGGSYTIVAMRRDGKVGLEAYRDGGARGGTARLRTINAAGELGEAGVTLDGRPLVRSVATGEASPYETVDPGTYNLDITRAGGGGGALASRPSVALSAGTATTAIALGTGGERTRVILVSDGTAAPSRAPATGLGGLEGGTPWLTALLAALGAGALGGAAHTLVRRRAA